MISQEIVEYIVSTGDFGDGSASCLHDELLNEGCQDQELLESIFYRDSVARTRSILSLSPVAEDIPGLRMRPIPPGKFLMGSPDSDDLAYQDEKPQHEVEIPRAFWMSESPVTESQWQTVMGTRPSQNGDDCPVVNVSWHDCQAFCKALSEKTGKHYRLPTEEEWEYACRAGTTTRYWSGDTEEDLARVGWYNGNSGNRIHRVAELPANPFGLYDMHGNVWEWCQDIYEPYEDKLAKRKEDEQSSDPTPPASCTVDLLASHRGTAASPTATRAGRRSASISSGSASPSEDEQRSDPTTHASCVTVAGSTLTDTVGTTGRRTASGTCQITGITASVSASASEGEQSSDPTQPTCFAVDLLATRGGSAATAPATGTRRRTATVSWASASVSEDEQSSDPTTTWRSAAVPGSSQASAAGLRSAPGTRPRDGASTSGSAFVSEDEQGPDPISDISSVVARRTLSSIIADPPTGFVAHQDSVNPTSDSESSGIDRRIFRGGSFYDTRLGCHAAYRDGGVPDDRYFTPIGFRPCMIMHLTHNQL